MTRRIDTADDLAVGLAALAAIDPALAAIHLRIGDPPLRREPGGLEGLVRIVIAQQLSVASAGAIWRRASAALSPLTAASLIRADDEVWRRAGLSRGKIRTLRAVATAIIEGRLDFDQPDPSALRVSLLALPGIGPWTVDIYALFCLGDADGFAPGDLALREGARLALGLEQRPDAAALAAIAERWRPWRGVAARLLWAYYAARRGAVAPLLPEDDVRDRA